MTELSEKSTDTTRRHILRAACREFAEKAVMDERTAMTRASILEIMSRRLSGLESIIDIVYLVAAQDYTTEVGRAGSNLMDSMGRIEGVQAKRLDEWVKGMSHAVVRGLAEGDIVAGSDPEDVARLIIAVYTGTRLTTELDNAEQFLRNMEKNWNFVLPGFTTPDRIKYFSEFIHRRTTQAVKNWRREADGQAG